MAFLTDFTITTLKMKIFFKLLTIVWCIGCIACTDTTEKTIAQLEEKQELFGVNKEDYFTDVSGGDRDEPDGYEE
ncbi:hypothetical protein [Tenacibaculum maritimum]|uniref:hypothetical protein n=1 Tax=Tenacibaculum maritimum TaxID=107401 RepID=UPI00132F6C70|nr:hypothetical protein [Tenacibaculum maritimum]